MRRLISFLSILTVAAPAAFAQPEPAPAQPAGEPPRLKEAEEWVKQMHASALKMISQGHAARERGDEKTALNRYTAALEIYKAALSEDERAALVADIAALRAKLGVKGHEEPVNPPKQVDLNDPEVASKRTDAMRLLSEAEQYLEEGRDQEAGQLFTRLYSRFRPVLLTEEEQRVTHGLMTARERLGLPALPPGDQDVLPYVVRTGDMDIDSFCLLVTGTFGTDAKAASDSQPRLMMGSGAVQIEGLNNAVYFEVAREDDLANPFRQFILTLYRTDQQLRLRVLDLPHKGLRNAVVGLWAATDVFPKLSASDLTINADLVLTRNPDGSGYTARTSGRVPTMQGGAVLMTSQFKVNADGITMDDRGYDAGGKEVWRSGGDTGVTFLRTAPRNIVTRRDSGVVILDLVPGTGDEGLTRGGEIAMHFSYWAANGTMVGTSRFAERPPQRVRYPINFIQGLDEGLDGIKVGTRRRFVIPPELAWGAQGNNWQVPPNTPVVFDVECLWVQAPATPPPVGPVAPEAGPSTPTGGGH